jgi:hypothetical protein
MTATNGTGIAGELDAAMQRAVAGVRREIAADMKQIAEQAMNRYAAQTLPQVLTNALSQIAGKVNVPPVVNVSTPEVKPSVNVSADLGEPNITLQLPGMAELMAEIKNMRADLAACMAMMTANVTKTVHRDPNTRLITSVTETRK